MLIIDIAIPMNVAVVTMRFESIHAIYGICVGDNKKRSEKIVNQT